MSIYAMIHVPVDEQPAVFDAITRWLVPGGTLLALVGDTPTRAAVEDDRFGAPMYWSHGDREFYRRLLRDRSYSVVREWYVPEDGGGHAAFLARAPSPDGVGAPR